MPGRQTAVATPISRGWRPGSALGTSFARTLGASASCRLFALPGLALLAAERIKRAGKMPALPVIGPPAAEPALLAGGES